jgi:hypothetical protein
MFPTYKVQWIENKGEMVIDGSYDISQKMMADSKFLDALMNFPKEQINDETVELLQPYFQAADYSFEAAQKASGNVAGLCNWTKAMCTYHVIAKVVEPKIASLREAEGELKIAMKERKVADDKMAEVQGGLDKMQKQFDEAMAEKQRLEDDALSTQKKMDSANALITALGGEETRWTQQSQEFEDQIQRLTGESQCAPTRFLVFGVSADNRLRIGLASSRIPASSGWCMHRLRLVNVARCRRLCTGVEFRVVLGPVQQGVPRDYAQPRLLRRLRGALHPRDQEHERVQVPRGGLGGALAWCRAERAQLWATLKSGSSRQLCRVERCLHGSPSQSWRRYGSVDSVSRRSLSLSLSLSHTHTHTHRCRGGTSRGCPRMSCPSRTASW